MRTVLIYSGGMDSSTLLFKLRRARDKVLCLTFDYGQRHKIEIRYARAMCKKLRVPHKVIDLKGLHPLMTGSALTSNIVVPEGHYEDVSMRRTVVPNRNMIFLSIAIACAVSRKYDRVALAVHAGDHAIYPDCRPSFIKKMNEVARSANYEKISIYAPFLHMTKKDIAKLGRALHVPFEETWTCYKGLAVACSKCGACRERNEALAKVR